MPVFTAQVVRDMLADDRHHGFGYACSEHLGETRRVRLDAAVAAVASELGIGPEALFAWCDSKWGRWLVDGICGRNERVTQDTVRGYLNEETIHDLVSELGMKASS